MKRALLRNVCVYARSRLLPPPYNPGPPSQLAPLADSTRPRISFYSIQSSSHNQEVCNAAVGDVSNKDLLENARMVFFILHRMKVHNAL
ncbi:unnamed protein product [Prunus armeniaca]|uniref:Uncharacterized protein n=1 Tax=Prunus armeniaca TaxID=36596 RepID=A0A6J5X1L0_PRUAR|nr:unnamed protein product [Prunus armeniaca]